MSDRVTRLGQIQIDVRPCPPRGTFGLAAMIVGAVAAISFAWGLMR
jgi:hypothetical protein